MSKRFIVTGNGTDVGKTVASAILATCLKADYWKPIQCGSVEGSDSQWMTHMLDVDAHRVFSPAYTLSTPLSPHHAARLEGKAIHIEEIHVPHTSRTLIIETAGGLLVPLSTKKLAIDYLSLLQAKWIIVSRHYVGSINHTLLTLEVLRRRQLPIAGIIFNGEANLDTEEAILSQEPVPVLGRIYPEPTIDKARINYYAKKWRKNVTRI